MLLQHRKIGLLELSKMTCTFVETQRIVRIESVVVSLE